MKKIISLFKRNYEGDKLVYNEVVPGAEWVINGEGVATLKFDGRACMIKDGKLYKRYDRKLKKGIDKNKKITIDDYKSEPEGWIPCEDLPDPITHHWPGWVPVTDGPEDKHLRSISLENAKDGTFEFIGPKVNGNPHKVKEHALVKHAGFPLYDFPRDFDSIKEYLKNSKMEGIVWHHPDGRMVKIKRRDFGFEWPIKEGG